jgi:radical SAM protein with 4Fe4S-binding SPASM domain
MIRIAKKANIFTITSTNGHYLTPSKCRELIECGLDRLLISIDGSSQEVYEQYRRDGQLSKVIEGTKNLISERKKMGATNPFIVFQMLVVAPNEHQIEEVGLLANDLGVDELVLKTAQVYDFQNGNPLIPKNQKFARYTKTQDGLWIIKNALQNQCWKMWHSAVSTWDGNILPCCFDKDATYRMGNITQRSFSDIWFSRIYNDFRYKILQSRKEIDICTNCSEGTKVWETI